MYSFNSSLTKKKIKPWSEVHIAIGRGMYIMIVICNDVHHCALDIASQQVYPDNPMKTSF